MPKQDASTASHATTRTIGGISPSRKSLALEWVHLSRAATAAQSDAGTDCGFAQEEINRRVHPSIMWAKLEAMAEGARIASRV